MNPVLIGLLVLLTLALVGSALNGFKTLLTMVKDVVKGIFKGTVAFFKSPVKFIKGINAMRLERKIRKTERKLAKKVMKEDEKARLNAALKNPSYINAKSVKPTATKLEALKAKRK